MKQWAQTGTWNFEHKLHLMEAEEQFSHGLHETAKESYKCAILCARAHKFINDEAFACELTAKFYLNIGDLALSMEHFILAHEKYESWGAVAKAAALFASVNNKFADSVMNNPLNAPIQNMRSTGL